MVAGHKTMKAAIVALERTYGACPVVTFQFPTHAVSGTLLVTLTLCEWQRVAQQIADAASAIGS